LFGSALVTERLSMPWRISGDIKDN
jgi:hypothetical protein